MEQDEKTRVRENISPPPKKQKFYRWETVQTHNSQTEWGYMSVIELPQHLTHKNGTSPPLQTCKSSIMFEILGCIMYKIWDSFGSCIMSLLMDSDNRGKKMGTKITGFSCVKAKVRFRGGFYFLIINTKYKTVHTYTCFLKTSIENIVV